VAFIVLLEGRVLGYVHIRKGPNRVGFIGIFQPFSDAIKLFTREQYFPLFSHYLSYHLSPTFRLLLPLLVCVLIPYFRGFISFEFGLLFVLCCTSLGVYIVYIVYCLYCLLFLLFIYIVYCLFILFIYYLFI
jgi:NADH-ubiquinone oxidoreductase chain 1